MISKAVMYGLGGAGGLLLLMAIVKKKKKTFPSMGTSQVALPGPKQYRAAGGDRASGVFSRFGIKIVDWLRANPGNTQLIAGKVYNLPPGVADMGTRGGAMGAVL